MYRYSVDNAVTYTSEDFVLFRESPFACWMERLTLENPDHGIPADLGSVPPGDSIERQDDMAETLRAQGKDVCLIDWDADEPSRRSATLAAMRRGADFIVNGQLALGPLSGAANLLVRTSGYSELGDFLYIPCDTQARSNLHSAFRLCFLADLLHSLQGQLPPQMLIIRGGVDLLPLQTDSHIYHYRAVKQRFMEAMRGFRKHRMPDPAESSHFGRWSDCAHEVLKQRMLGDDRILDEITDEDYAEPLRKAVGTGNDGGFYETDHSRQAAMHSADARVEAGVATDIPTMAEVTASQGGAAGSFTLAEQARMLKPGTYKPGPGVFRLGPPRAARIAQVDEARERRSANPARGLLDAVLPGDEAAPVADTPRPKYNRRASDAALQNLEFIGSSSQLPGIGLDTAPAAELPPEIKSAPAPSLRHPGVRNGARVKAAAVTAPGREQSAVPGSTLQVAETGTRSPASPPAAVLERPPQPDRSTIDMDDTYPATPPTGLTTCAEKVPAGILLEEEDVSHGFGVAAHRRKPDPEPRPFSDSIFNDSIFTEGSPRDDRFSSNLITSGDYED
jgi:hypothetical protein